MRQDQVAILATNLSKQYAFRSDRFALSSNAKGRRFGQITRRSRRFFALSDVSFTVNRGEGVAVFGMNGSGKTTLLQLLAHVMAPTSGKVQLHGRHTAVLGATLGILPGLTGLENVYLMAAMYGVRLDKDEELLDKIIDFADIGDFMYTYVNNLSSGMKARLGFSVAIHALPEIVLIDEVLRVGDIQFKEKCDERIQQLKQRGRTFMIVSHNVKTVEHLCERAIWLHEGQLMWDGPTQKTWKEYRAIWRSARGVNPARRT